MYAFVPQPATGVEYQRHLQSGVPVFVYTVKTALAGVTYGFTLDGSTYTYTAGAGDQRSDIASGVAAALAAEPIRNFDAEVWDFDDTKLILTFRYPYTVNDGTQFGSTDNNEFQEPGDPAPVLPAEETVVPASDNPYTSMGEQVEADLEALEPPDYTKLKYLRDETDGADEDIFGASGGRVFQLVWLSDELDSHASKLLKYYERFEIRLRLKRLTKNKKDFDLAVRAEAINIQNRINRRENWPVDGDGDWSIESVQVNRATRIEREDGDIDVTIEGLLHSMNSVAV
jgi:hypothetical protein